ncbi:MAG: aldo/keto reductase [Terrimicrobiaceae bacterium]|nr:aldo/keto reductase [Terrimicrobiaceae bacterium]
MAGAGVLLASAAGRAFSAGSDEPATTRPAQVLRRKFGRHDFTVSSMVLGGHALRLASDEEALRIVDGALDRGLNFFDNASDYFDGKAEELMGRAIKGRRDKVFLMTKLDTHGRGGRAEIMKFLEGSLQRLGTDHLDLWQLHAVASMDHVKHAFSSGGPLEVMQEAQKRGKVRFIGFTGHTDPDVHLAMLSKGFPFDSCQMPISPIEANSNAFVKRVLPELLKQRIAPLAMKTLGGNGKSVQDGVLTVREAISYALSHPVAAVVSGITSEVQLSENAGVAAAYVPMPEDALIALEERCKAATEANKYQPYRKWGSYRDGDAAAGLV